RVDLCPVVLLLCSGEWEGFFVPTSAPTLKSAEGLVQNSSPQVVMLEHEHDDLKFVVAGNVEIANVHV
ncbi:hypothetical protein L195_g036909, partial [Trifolium pratense]